MEEEKQGGNNLFQLLASHSGSHSIGTIFHVLVRKYNHCQKIFFPDCEVDTKPEEGLHLLSLFKLETKKCQKRLLVFCGGVLVGFFFSGVRLFTV